MQDYLNWKQSGGVQVPEPYMVYGKENREEGTVAVQELQRDMDYFRSLYPNSVRELQVRVEEACDRMEYDNSPMYDEYPDRVMVNQVSDSIYKSVLEEMQKREDAAGPQAKEIEEVEVYELNHPQEYMNFSEEASSGTDQQIQEAIPLQSGYTLGAEPVMVEGEALGGRPPQGPGPVRPPQGPGPGGPGGPPPWGPPPRPPQGPGPVRPPQGPGPGGPGGPPPWGLPPRPPQGPGSVRPPQGPGPGGPPPWGPPPRPPQGPGPVRPPQGPGPGGPPPWGPPSRPPQGPGPVRPPQGPGPGGPGGPPPWGPPPRPPQGPGPVRPPQNNSGWLNDIIRVLLLNEMQRRRCHNRNCRL